MNTPYTPKHISGAGTTTVNLVGGESELGIVTIEQASANATLVITNGEGTTIANLASFNTAVPRSIWYECRMIKGITVVTAGSTIEVTILYR